MDGVRHVQSRSQAPACSGDYPLGLLLKVGVAGNEQDPNGITWHPGSVRVPLNCSLGALPVLLAALPMPTISLAHGIHTVRVGRAR
ncbi:hypothetical protein D3C73_1532810 [compost metagenome]